MWALNSMKKGSVWLAAILLLLPVFTAKPVSAAPVASVQKLLDICLSEWEVCPTDNVLTPVGNRLFFLADDGEHGRELWVSDGSPAGTTMVKDLYPGEAGFEPFGADSIRLAHVGKLLFRADDPSGTHNLWVTDGTESGTKLVGAYEPFSLVGLNGMAMIFSTSSGMHYLRTTDGTPDGTTIIKTIPLADVVSVTGFANEDYLYFLFHMDTDAASNPGGGYLWRTDGTSDGTLQLAEIPNMPGVSNLVGLSGSVYFISNYMLPDPPMTSVSTLWGSDGTPGGTHIVATFPYQGVIPILTIAATSDLLFFGARRQAEPPILWQSDGTPAGTLPVQDSGGPFFPSGFAVYQDTLYFHSFDGPDAYYRTSGKENGGIVKFADHVMNNATFWANPQVVGDSLYLLNSDGAGHDVWWRTDGINLVPVVDPVHPYTEPEFRSADGDHFLFMASTPEYGSELWTTDGTSVGTRMVADLTPGNLSAILNEFTVVGNKVFFVYRVTNQDVDLYVMPLLEKTLFLPAIRK